MGRFGIGLAILFAIMILIPIVHEMNPVIVNLVTGTTAANAMFTYLVPATIVVGGLAAIFVVWFKPFGKFRG